MTIQLCAMSLVNDLRPLAGLKNPGYCWSGTEYGAHTRGQSIDYDGLIRHSSALQIILGHARSGFPGFKKLKQAFAELNRLCGLWPATESDDGNSSLAANQWRLMAKDVYTVKKSGDHTYDKLLQPLVDMIDLSIAFPPEKGSADKKQKRQSGSGDPIVELSDNDDDDFEVESDDDSFDLPSGDEDGDATTNPTCDASTCDAGVVKPSDGGEVMFVSASCRF